MARNCYGQWDLKQEGDKYFLIMQGKLILQSIEIPKEEYDYLLRTFFRKDCNNNSLLMIKKIHDDSFSIDLGREAVCSWGLI